MSVQMNQYAAFGYLLNYDEAHAALVEKYGADAADEMIEKYYDSQYDEEIVEINGFSIVDDPMDCKYTFFGKIYAKSECDEPLEEFVFSPVENELIQALEQELINVFGTSFENKAAQLFFSHYR